MLAFAVCYIVAVADSKSIGSRQRRCNSTVASELQALGPGVTHRPSGKHDIGAGSDFVARVHAALFDAKSPCFAGDLRISPSHPTVSMWQLSAGRWHSDYVELHMIHEKTTLGINSFRSRRCSFRLRSSCHPWRNRNAASQNIDRVALATSLQCPMEYKGMLRRGVFPAGRYEWHKHSG